MTIHSYSVYGTTGGRDGLLRRYQGLYLQAWFAEVAARLRGRSLRLLDLAASLNNQSKCGSRSGGLQVVPIRAIRGSENRCHDFDQQFRPRQTNTWDRWQSVATAWVRGIDLPPVELVQVGNTFYVRDGHHRISVARALGQRDVDAVVTVLDVAIDA